MSPKEIIFRASKGIQVFFEYVEYQINTKFLSKLRFYPTILPKDINRTFHEDIVKAFRHKNRDRFFTEIYDKDNRLHLIREFFDGPHWVSEANRIMNGELDLLGKSIQLPHGKGWQCDPIEKKFWPDDFYAKVKRNEKVKNWDIKYIWEINRHQFLIVLGKAFWLTGDERYADKIFFLIDNWIDHNPCNEGVNWTSSLELAVRSISWIWTFFFCSHSKERSLEFEKAFLTSLFQHAAYIEKHLSYYSSPYNHLIGEAAALHLIGSLLGEMPAGKRWEELGWSILKSRINDQFHEDGMSVEQATFYHHFTLGFYLQSVVLRLINNKPVSEKVLKRIEKALEFSLHITKPDGTIPMIGDTDNARSLYFNLSHRWDFRGFLSLGAILFDRPDFKERSSGISEELLWLSTEKDLTRFMRMDSASPVPTSSPFFHSGYFISRDNWEEDANYLCFDCGEIAAGLSPNDLPSAAHGHADALSFELAVKGRSFIVDGGFYTYFGGLDWHKYFRHEEAHNTVILENHRQAEYCGRLKWKNVKKAELIQWESRQYHDSVTGKVMFNKSEFHLRQMTCAKNHFWVVRDRVHKIEKNTSIASFLHFAPQVELALNREKCEIFAVNDDLGLLIKYFGHADVALEKGGNKPNSGWVAHGYGIKHPAWVSKFLWKNLDCDNRLDLIFIPCRLDSDLFLSIVSEFMDKQKDEFEIVFKKDNAACSIKLCDSYTHFNIAQGRFDVGFPQDLSG